MAKLRSSMIPEPLNQVKTDFPKTSGQEKIGKKTRFMPTIKNNPKILENLTLIRKKVIFLDKGGNMAKSRNTARLAALQARKKDVEEGLRANEEAEKIQPAPETLEGNMDFNAGLAQSIELLNNLVNLAPPHIQDRLQAVIAELGNISELASGGQVPAEQATGIQPAEQGMTPEELAALSGSIPNPQATGQILV